MFFWGVGEGCCVCVVWIGRVEGERGGVSPTCRHDRQADRPPPTPPPPPKQICVKEKEKQRIPRVRVLEVLADDAHDGDQGDGEDHARDAPQHGPEGYGCLWWLLVCVLGLVDWSLGACLVGVLRTEGVGFGGWDGIVSLCEDGGRGWIYIQTLTHAGKHDVVCVVGGAYRGRG